MQLALEELADLQEALEWAEEQTDETQEQKPESNRGKRKPLDAKIPEDLPVEIIVIEPDEVKANPELWEKIDDRSVAPVVTPTPETTD